MCGVIGIVSNEPVNQALYDGLIVLQHRGQDAAGIISSDGRKLYIRRANGMVKDVFDVDHMRNLKGSMGIAHVRYPTAGTSSAAEAQPFYVNTPYGISMAHNGNLTNSKQLKKELYEEDLRSINTESDSEVLLNVFAQELHKQMARDVKPEHIFTAVKGVHDRCQGAYAAVGMLTRYGLIGFRDPYGIRPLVYGVRETDDGSDYMIASESCALDGQGYRLISDIKPGEAIYITKDGDVHIQQCSESPIYRPCLFEYVYFSRPDSMIDDVYVHKARIRMGHNLAEHMLKEGFGKEQIDVVIPIPETSRTSALELAYTLGVPYREGFIKNRYIGRTFIMPGQNQRKKSVRQKLNPLGVEFKGKNVLLVDDSIVRGTTSRQIVRMARSMGAKKVYFASAAPAIRYPNIYGIDMPAANELIAHNRTEEEVAEKLEVDRIFFQSLDDLKEAVKEGNDQLQAFDCSVFTGEYVTGVDKGYFIELERLRNDTQKASENDPTVQAAVDIAEHY